MVNKGSAQIGGNRGQLEKIWKLILHNKQKILVWRLFLNSLPDADSLRKISREIERSCVECRFKVENALHVVTGCWKAKTIWEGLGIGLVIGVYAEDPGGGYSIRLTGSGVFCHQGEIRKGKEKAVGGAMLQVVGS
ncbi:hypothetical protein QQ045_021074 [Rhodiola kirilowii]